SSSRRNAATVTVSSVTVSSSRVGAAIMASTSLVGHRCGGFGRRALASMTTLPAAFGGNDPVIRSALQERYTPAGGDYGYIDPLALGTVAAWGSGPGSEPAYGQKR